MSLRTEGKKNLLQNVAMQDKFSFAAQTIHCSMTQRRFNVSELPEVSEQRNSWWERETFRIKMSFHLYFFCNVMTHELKFFYIFANKKAQWILNTKQWTTLHWKWFVSSNLVFPCVVDASVAYTKYTKQVEMQTVTHHTAATQTHMRHIQYLECFFISINMNWTSLVMRKR